MAVAPAPGTGQVTSDPTTDTPRSARFRLVLLGVLVVLLLATLGTMIWLAATRLGGTADREQSDREAVMSTTQQFVMRVNTYGPDELDSSGQMPQYRKLVKEVITPKFAVSFDQSVTAAEQSVKNYGLQRVCAVYGTGVEVLDADSAQVLVAGSFSQSYENKKGKRVSTGDPNPFRLRVSLVKINDQWLVDDYEPITGPGE